MIQIGERVFIDRRGLRVNRRRHLDFRRCDMNGVLTLGTLKICDARCNGQTHLDLTGWASRDGRIRCLV